MGEPRTMYQVRVMVPTYMWNKAPVVSLELFIDFIDMTGNINVP